MSLHHYRIADSAYGNGESLSWNQALRSVSFLSRKRELKFLTGVDEVGVFDLLLVRAEDYRPPLSSIKVLSDLGKTVAFLNLICRRAGRRGRRRWR